MAMVSARRKSLLYTKLQAEAMVMQLLKGSTPGSPSPEEVTLLNNAIFQYFVLQYELFSLLLFIPTIEFLSLVRAHSFRVIVFSIRIGAGVILVRLCVPQVRKKSFVQFLLTEGQRQLGQRHR